ncbi:fimbrial protein [Serratia marcescens]|uniref:fimbrial protein n=1 Tax=Serratia marcescens TaxID=615 RepID=UPI003EE04972
MNVKAIAMIIGASLMTSTAYAASEGKITFIGSITDAPCSIAAGSLDQVIPLGGLTSPR